ncbi:MAG: carboxypeptidase regulatory-like domain-containing protein [Bryobacterales bacterium]|nr:carboxypeptidase regulatory-like domain-containing protein [Bryobacterales bacterium]
MSAGAAAGKQKKEKPAPPMGVIAGSVFRETGFSFAGVEVVVVWEVEGRKKKEWKGRTDSRGEFAFRVPAAEGRYAVRVRADGHEPVENQVDVGIDERKELSIIMKLEKK